MFIQRIRVRFRKTGPLKAISHLDLMRAFERALRRTGLPLRMSEGYNPRPRLSFPAALGVGIEGLDEVMEFDLADWVPVGQVEQRLREQMPPGMDVVQVTLGSPHDTAQAVEVWYRVRPSAALRDDPRIAAYALARLMDRDEVNVQRIRKGKQKSVNIRPLILSLEREGNAILMKMTAGQAGSVHPEEILVVLGFDAATCRQEFHIERTRVRLSDEPDFPSPVAAKA